MSNKKIILLSILLGLASALMVMIYLTDLKDASSSATYRKVVVAKENIPAKTQIKSSMLEVKSIPKDYINSEAYSKTSDIIDKIAKNDILPGEQLLKEKVAGNKDIEDGMSYTIPEGKRALTISVNQVTGVNGFIKPGDFVDAGATMDIEIGDQRKKETVNKVIVQKIKVLAVENIVSQTTSKDKSDTIELKTITLLVNADDTRIVMLANDKGTLHLLLRSPSEDKNITSAPFMPENFLIQ